MRLAPCLALLAACSSVEEPFTESFDATGLDTLRVEMGRGLVNVVALDVAEVTVEGRSIGRGSSPVSATERARENEWTMDVDGSALVITTASPAKRASVELDITVPLLFDLDLAVDDGSVYATGAEGVHDLTGSQVVTTSLRGQAAVHATAWGADVEVYPWTNGRVDLDSTSGDVVLRVPTGGQYDVEVLGDAQFEMYVEDFGFGSSVANPGYFQGIVGAGTVPIRVGVVGGSFQLLASF